MQRKIGRNSTKPRKAWKYQPTRRRNPGRPRIQWGIDAGQAMGPSSGR
jgi:hypothetical protein